MIQWRSGVPTVVDVLFRLDASKAIGSGHLTRSKALADELLQRGIHSAFAMHGPLEGSVQQLLRSGHDVVRLDGRGWWHQHITRLNASLVVVDSYDVGSSELREVSSSARLAVIDDDASRDLSPATLIVNPNPIITPEDVIHGRSTKLLLGTDYALIDAHFSCARSQTRTFGDVGSIAVALGAADSSGSIEPVLDAVRNAWDVPVRVAGDIRPVRDKSPTSDVHWLGVLDAKEMAGLMLAADIFVASPSTLAWELCATATPSVFLQTAPNQRRIAGWLRSEVVAPVCTDVADLYTKLDAAQWSLEERVRLSKTMGRFVDGLGAARIAEVVEEML